MSFLSARIKAGLTQSAAAEALGVKASAVCQWEKGETFPSAKRLEKIAELYSCTVDCLLKKEDA